MALYSWYLNNSKGNNSTTNQVARCSNWPIAKVDNGNSSKIKVLPMAKTTNDEIISTSMLHYKMFYKNSFIAKVGKKLV